MALQRLVLTIALKVSDNEARSALEAIRVKMGLADRVRDLLREDVWELEVEAESPGAARETVLRLVEMTNLFANPNKHRYSLSEADEASGSAALAADEAAVLVSDREGTEGESMVAAVRRLGIEVLVGARRWTRWRVRLAETPSPGDPDLVPLLRKIGVATGRRGGLLCNPHSQICRAILPWGAENRLAG